MNRSLLLFAAALVTLTACEPTFDYGVKKYEVKRLRSNLEAQPCSKEVFVPLVEVMSEAGDREGVRVLTEKFTAACGALPWTPWLTFDYGAKLSEVKGLAEALEKEPCDKSRIVKLLDRMVSAGDYRGTLTRADAFFAKCGDLPRARWLTFAAHKHLSEYDAAIVEATKLIDSDRFDQDFWWWRSGAYTLAGQHEKALADLLEVKKLCAGCFVGWEIADATEKLGRPCEGLGPLEDNAADHPDARDIGQLRARIASLRALPACGVAAVPTPRGDRRPGRPRPATGG